MPDSTIRLTVRVQPRASRNRFRIDPDGRIVVHITAPPVDGAANDALCAFVGRILGVRKSAVSVEKGERGRDKILAVSGMTPESLKARLQTLNDSSLQREE